MFKKTQAEQNRNDEKYSLTGIAVKIHTNHDGVRATAIMLRSIAAISSSRSLVIAVKIASEITLAFLRMNKELALVSFPMRWVEGHISHSRRVLRRYRPKQPSCSRQFGCRLFIKHTHWAVFSSHEKTCLFMSHNSAALHWTFHFQILY